MPSESLPRQMPGPFGGVGEMCQAMPVARIVEMYRRKCGVDVAPAFGGRAEIGLYRCKRTGYRFWRPAEVAGDEAFYRMLSAAWPNYYRAHRWEYDLARNAVRTGASVLEIGCGPGHYLKSLEDTVQHALGIEFNAVAIANKVTAFPIVRSTVESLAAERPGAFQVVHAFQVLEHIPDPGSFLRAAVACLADDGFLILSTPNHEHEPFRKQEDAFDLPPHHIGHFDGATYEALADVLGLRVVELAREEAPRRGFLRTLAGVLHPIQRQTGPNILVIYQK